jgi:hypothetical protein
MNFSTLEAIKADGKIVMDWSKQPYGSTKNPIFIKKRDKDYNTQTFYDVDFLEKPKSVLQFQK